MGHKLTFPGNVGKYTSKVFPGLDVLRRFDATNLITFVNTLSFKSNNHRDCSL